MSATQEEEGATEAEGTGEERSQKGSNDKPVLNGLKNSRKSISGFIRAVWSPRGGRRGDEEGGAAEGDGDAEEKGESKEERVDGEPTLVDGGLRGHGREADLTPADLQAQFESPAAQRRYTPTTSALEVQKWFHLPERSLRAGTQERPCARHPSRVPRLPVPEACTCVTKHSRNLQRTLARSGRTAVRSTERCL